MPITATQFGCEPTCIVDPSVTIYCQADDGMGGNVWHDWEIPHVTSVTPGIERNQPTEQRTSHTKRAFVRFCNFNNATYTFTIEALDCESEPYSAYLREGELYYIRVSRRKAETALNSGVCVPVGPFCEFQGQYQETKPTLDANSVDPLSVTHTFESFTAPIFYGYEVPDDSFEDLMLIDPQRTNSPFSLPAGAVDANNDGIVDPAGP